MKHVRQADLYKMFLSMHQLFPILGMTDCQESGMVRKCT
jgi:hypothetical protein